MKALIYEKAHSLDNFSIHLADIPEPEIRDLDVLVEVHAIGINPGEAFFRGMRSAEPGGRVLLGYEFAGLIAKVGAHVPHLKVGDRVFGTGDLTRDGAWAQRVAIDHRIVARIPDKISFTGAASLPIGALTAWEALFRDQNSLPSGINRVLIVGGAGAVGSMATQILKAKTNAVIISTASRDESRQWCLKMGADHVIDHSKDVEKQLAALQILNVDMVLSTAKTVENLGWITKLLRSFGHLSIVDAGPSLDSGVLMMKSLSIHLEMVFSRVLHGSGLESQREILENIADLLVKGKIQPIVSKRLVGLNADTMKDAHRQVESKKTAGKVVIEVVPGLQ